MDIAWGTGYIIGCIWLYVNNSPSILFIVVSVLILIWGLRLAIYILIRNSRKKEDFRYFNWRKSWGKWFYVRSYFQVFAFQSLLLVIIMTPVVNLSLHPFDKVSILPLTGIIIWLGGFSVQTIADYQLSIFIRTRKTKGSIMKTGIWKYSRHPNYFGEITMWWGIFIITLPAGNSITGLIGPLLITYLIIFVSGIPMLEKKYKDNEEYQKYKSRTSVLLPLPNKK